MTSLDKKDKINGLLQLAKIHREQFDERRRTEWKLVYVILAFYIGLITTKITAQIGGNNADIGMLKYLLGTILIVLAIGGIWYLKEIHKANHKNKSFAKNAENAVRNLIRGVPPNLDIFTYVEKKIWEDWSFEGQVTLLMVLAIGSAIIIAYI